METVQVAREQRNRTWMFRIASGLIIFITLMLAVAAVYFHEEIQNIQSYGYVGVFFIGVLCGISIIPVPTLLLVFTMGSALNPLYVGLIAGFGGGVGGITVYLTGAGMMHIGSRFLPSGFSPEDPEDVKYGNNKAIQTKFWVKGQAYYNRILKWVGGKGGAWTLFIISATIISPFYFAGLAAGSLRMGLLKFFLISWAGKTVRALTLAFAGYWGLQFILEWIGR